MAANLLCKIEDCDKPAKRREWCNAHYKRWRRHGDPLAGRVANGEPMRFFRDVALAYDGDECLIWPFYRMPTGYGMMNTGTRPEIVSRLVCIEAHGPPPTPKHEAAHSCGKGCDGCVNKRHLSWKTHADNMADTIAHGTANRDKGRANTKLTGAEALEIFASKGKTTYREAAAKYGVCEGQIKSIRSGKGWGWLTCSPS